MTVFVHELSISCALGDGPDAVAEALFAPTPSGVGPTSAYADQALHLGCVTAALPDAEAWPLGFRSRNNQLLAHVVAPLRAPLEQAVARFGRARVAAIVGTSTSGIAEGEVAIAAHQRHGALPPTFAYSQLEIGNPADFVNFHLGLPVATVISTACSSSAKALASAGRLLEAGLVDVVLAGGVDTLCRFTVAGFSALEAATAQRCNPLSVNRRGINIGEAGAFFLLSREPGPVRLAGWGETSDAHHMSAPEPSGRGARAAIEAALRRAGRAGPQVDYVNLHGTATPQNDAMESLAVAQTVGLEVPVSSTKPLTGHTLGAAGALEAALCVLALRDPLGRLPPHHWDGERDPALPPLRVVAPGERLGRAPRVALSNSFAFGGSNAALVLERE